MNRSSPVVASAVLVGCAVLGWAIVFAVPDLVIGGDPTVYRERLLALEAGGVPYLDPVFEHLPGVLIPLYAARLLSGFGGEFAYAVSFTVLMLACLIMTFGLLARAGHELASPRLGWRWILVAFPLVPLVVFRNDPWTVMLMVMTVTPAPGAVARSIAAVLGPLSKGWPVVAVPGLWHEGKRRLAAAVAGSGAIAVGLMATPGFRATQQAAGVHSETLGGSLLGLWRATTGEDLGIRWTTAVYLDAAWYWFVLGPAIGLVLVVSMWRLLGLDWQPRTVFLSTGVLVIVVLLSSPLLSTQYVLWATPFVAAAGRRIRAIGLLASLASIVSILWWDSLFDPATWWWLLVALRNVALVAIGIMLAREAVAASRDGARQGVR